MMLSIICLKFLKKDAASDQDCFKTQTSAVAREKS